MAKGRDWERGFSAGHASVFPRLTEALGKIALLEGENAHLKNIVTAYERRDALKAEQECREAVAETRWKHSRP